MSDLRATAPFGRRNSILALKSGREMGGAFEAGAQRDFVDCGSAVRRVGKSLVRCIKPELAQRRANRLALVLKDAVQVAHGDVVAPGDRDRAQVRVGQVGLDPAVHGQQQ